MGFDMDELLRDQSLRLTGKSLMISESQSLETAATRKKSTLNLVLPDSSGRIRTVSAACRGELTIMEHVDVPELPEIVIPPRTVVSQPDNLTSRHPLFGLIEAIPEAIRGSSPSISSSAKKKKKKKRNESLAYKLEI